MNLSFPPYRLASALTLISRLFDLERISSIRLTKRDGQGRFLSLMGFGTAATLMMTSP